MSKKEFHSHDCPSHPNPLCPMKEGKGKCGLCGFDHDKPSLSREDLRAKWEAAGAKGREALAKHIEGQNEVAREEAEKQRWERVELKAQIEAKKEQEIREEKKRKETEEREKAEKEEKSRAKREADTVKKEKAQGSQKLKREQEETKRKAEESSGLSKEWLLLICGLVGLAVIFLVGESRGCRFNWSSEKIYSCPRSVGK